MHPIVFWILAPIAWLVGWVVFCFIPINIFDLGIGAAAVIGMAYGIPSGFLLMSAYDEWVN